MSKLLRYTFFCLFCALLCALPGMGLAEPSYEVVDGRVVGHIVRDDGQITIDIDMPVPMAFPDATYNWQVERIRISEKAFTKALEGKMYQDSDVFFGGISIENKRLEENYSFLDTYGQGGAWLVQSCIGVPLLYQGSDKQTEVMRAEQVVRGVLDELEIPYIYPFFSVSRAQDLYDVLCAIPEVDHIGGPIRETTILNKPFLESQVTFIVARYPVATLSMIGSPTLIPPLKKNNGFDYDAGGYAFFVVDDDGMILNADITMPIRAKQMLAEGQRVMTWQQALDAYIAHYLQLDELWGLTNQQYAVQFMEPCYAVNGFDVAYPVWSIAGQQAYDFVTYTTKVLVRSGHEHSFSRYAVIED